MAEFKLVISDPKAKKAYQIEIKSPEADKFIGMKLGEIIQGDEIGIPGFAFKITGGSDKQGFPMRIDIEGTKRVKVLVSKGPGFRPKRKGERRRKSLRGNTIADDIAQINLKSIKWGEKPLGVVLGKEEEKTEEAKESAEEKEGEQ